MRRYRAVLLLLFAIAVGFTAAIFIGVPLMPEQNDSAWYYINVHYLLTGQHIWESMYPSFTGPCQYYPMGYSLVILLAKGIQRATGIDWIATLRFLQFSAFAASGWLTYAVARLLGCRRLAVVAAGAYFLFFPFFNFSTFVMSENLAAFLLLLAAFLFLKGLKDNRDWALYGSFLVAGYSILVRPILLLAFPVLAGPCWCTSGSVDRGGAGRCCLLCWWPIRRECPSATV